MSRLFRGVCKFKHLQTLAGGTTTFNVAPTFNEGLSIPVDKTPKMAVKDNNADGAVIPRGIQTLSKATAGAYTLAAPTAGEICIITSKTAVAHVVTTASGVTFNGTNNTATWGAAIGNNIILVGLSATLWQIISMVGITLSTV